MSEQHSTDVAVDEVTDSVVTQDPTQEMQTGQSQTGAAESTPSAPVEEGPDEASAAPHVIEGHVGEADSAVDDAVEGASGDGDSTRKDGEAKDGEEERSEDPLDVEGEIAADYLEELLDIADLDGDIDTYVESGRAHVSVVTESDILVGKDGEVLDALQELARLAVVTETGHRSRLMLDVAGHRDKRRRELVELAGDAVQEAKAANEAVRLSPMNPFERKIVHDTVAAAGLTSESEGEEPNRRVVVTP